MANYHKVVLNGKPYYRKFCKSIGFYTGVVTEEELVKRLLAESTHSVIEVNEKDIEQALSYLHPFQKTLVETYINYLERVVESYERTHDITIQNVHETHDITNQSM